MQLAGTIRILVHDEPASLKTLIKKSLQFVNLFPLLGNRWKFLSFRVCCLGFFSIWSRIIINSTTVSTVLL